MSSSLSTPSSPRVKAWGGVHEEGDLVHVGLGLLVVLAVYHNTLVFLFLVNDIKIVDLYFGFAFRFFPWVIGLSRRDEGQHQEANGNKIFPILHVLMSSSMCEKRMQRYAKYRTRRT